MDYYQISHSRKEASPHVVPKQQIRYSFYRGMFIRRVTTHETLDDTKSGGVIRLNSMMEFLVTETYSTLSIPIISVTRCLENGFIELLRVHERRGFEKEDVLDDIGMKWLVDRIDNLCNRTEVLEWVDKNLYNNN